MSTCPPAPQPSEPQTVDFPMDMTRMFQMNRWHRDIDRVPPGTDLRPLMKSLVTQLFVQREMTHRLVGQEAREVFDYIIGFQGHSPYEETA